MSELLLEIGCEEIPAAMLDPAISSFKEYLKNQLQTAGVPSGAITGYHTPRRLTLHIADLAARQPDQVETVIGPPKAVCFDKDGQYTKAAHSFAGQHKVPLKALTTTTTARGEYMAVQKKTKGITTANLLSALLPQAIAAISFPKSMYWTDNKFRFARPIRWIVALLDGRVIRFTIAEVASGAKTCGHRMLSRRRRLRVSGWADYLEKLTRNYVVLDPLSRRNTIRAGLEATAASLGGVLRTDDELLVCVVNLNEFPTVIYGRFDEAYLSLPAEVLVTVKRSHQKYFSVLDTHGKMLPYFLTVINTQADAQGAIRLGHERVLRARLADAQFFWQTDTKRRLLDRREDLKHVLFQEKLGTYFDKTERISDLSRQIAEALSLSSELVEAIGVAASLCKTDLTTEMVKEFTDLQGILGGLYARKEGYEALVTEAIYDHYQPKNIDEPSPRSIAGAVLSLADKLDSIIGCFVVGLTPTGTRDPYGLRRQGNGLIKVLLDHRLATLSLEQLTYYAWKQLRPQLAAGQPEVSSTSAPAANERRPEIMEAAGFPYTSQLLPFFENRLRYIFESRGFQYDEINAALASGFDRPYETLLRIEALSKSRAEEDFLAISTAFKRIKNILRNQAGDGAAEVKLELLVEPAEKELHALFEGTYLRVQAFLSNHQYYEALKNMGEMRQSVDRFFDKVMVMADDLELRRNRLHLLRRMASLFTQVADISEIVVK